MQAVEREEQYRRESRRESSEANNERVVEEKRWMR